MQSSQFANISRERTPPNFLNGLARDRQPQAVEMSEQANRTGAPAQLPVAKEVVDVVVVVLVVVVVELDKPAEQD